MLECFYAWMEGHPNHVGGCCSHTSLPIISYHCNMLAAFVIFTSYHFLIRKTAAAGMVFASIF
jgi:hypothetical protein